jgi:hypothetical protein
MAAASELLQQRDQRIADALACRTPDRVPIYTRLDLFPVYYTGMSFDDAYYNVRNYLAAMEKVVVEFAPDVYKTTIFDGRSSATLGSRLWLWAGHGGPESGSFQFVEGEHLKSGDWDAYLRDPSGFTLRVLWPRFFASLAGLARLPSPSALLTEPASPTLISAEVQAAAQALAQAARESADFWAGYDEHTARMQELGFPIFYRAFGAQAPFDTISSYMRGMRGAMLDMFRCPDKLLAAEELILQESKGTGVALARATGNPRIFIPLHRGSDGFMSVDQFKRFYWPQLKEVILSYVDAGLTPCVFWEGTWDTRLEYLVELPPGKVGGIFDRTDLVKAKKILGGSMCFIGGMPVTLLQSGTLNQVRDETKRIIDTMAPGGGFIMCTNAPLDEAQPELLRTWIETTKEYGAQ